MKNKKGFTLIELLAIIVILAIIAVITVPIILNVIDNAKRGAAIDSAYGYKDAVQKLYVTKLSSDPTYSIPDGNYTTEQLKSMGLSVSGQEPKNNSWVTIEENNVTTGCLQYDEYKVYITDGKVGTTAKGTCGDTNDESDPSNPGTTDPSNPGTTDPSNPGTTESAFQTDSWADIKANLAADRNAYPIGSEKVVAMNLTGLEQYYKLRLVNTEPCSSSTATSKTSCGVVIEFVTVIGTYNMHSGGTNEGGWYESEMRSYLNSGLKSIYAYLKKYIGENIIITTSPVVSGSGLGVASNNATDYLYLLSTREVGLNVPYDNERFENSTNILSYYNSNNNNDARKKYSTTTAEGVDSFSSRYWLRSAHSDSTYYYLNIYGDGNYRYDASTDMAGVAPAFRILD